MDYSFVIFWVVSFAAILGSCGYLFGGLARVFAHAWSRSPERFFVQAFFRGGKQGAIFGAILGLPLGSFATYLQRLDPAGSDEALEFLENVGYVAAAAMVLGIIGYALESRTREEAGK